MQRIAKAHESQSLSQSASTRVCLRREWKCMLCHHNKGSKGTEFILFFSPLEQGKDTAGLAVSTKWRTEKGKKGKGRKRKGKKGKGKSKIPQIHPKHMQTWGSGEICKLGKWEKNWTMATGEATIRNQTEIQDTLKAPQEKEQNHQMGVTFPNGKPKAWNKMGRTHSQARARGDLGTLATQADLTGNPRDKRTASIQRPISKPKSQHD